MPIEKRQLHQYILIDSNLSSKPVVTLNRHMQLIGHLPVAFASNKEETVARIEELSVSKVIATLGIVGELKDSDYEKRGELEIVHLLHKTFPNIFILAFTESPSSTVYGDTILDKRRAGTISRHPSFYVSS